MLRSNQNANGNGCSPDSGPPLLLKVGQVAELLQCSPRLVWRLASEGKLHKVTLGPRCVRFSRIEVEEMVQDLAR